MNEAIQYSHFIYLLCTLLLLFLSHIGLIFFLLAQHLVKHHRWSALFHPTLCFFIVPLLEPVIKIDFLLGKKLPNGQLCHTAHVTALTSRNCRRSRGPTKAGLWIAWCCVTRWLGGWRMTSPSPPERECMSTASTWREPAGTAAAANSWTPSPKSSSRWCLWSGCMLRIMVRCPVWVTLDEGKLSEVPLHLQSQ